MSKRTKRVAHDGQVFWRARDASYVQTVLLALFYVPQLLLVPLIIDALVRGLWAQAGTRALAIAALWAARWARCTVLPRLVRWGWIQVRGLCGSRAI